MNLKLSKKSNIDDTTHYGVYMPIRPNEQGFFWQKPAIIALFLVMCVFVQFIIRLDYGPDEPYHVEYIHTLATTHQLPDKSDTYMVQHPPLFYALLSVPWKLLGVTQKPLSVTPGANALAQMEPNAVTARRVLRFLCAVMAAGSLLFLFKILQVMGLTRQRQAYIVCLLAGLPMLQYISSVINNEGLSILYSCAFCYFIVKRVMAQDCEIPDALVLGLIAGGGLTLIKQTTLFAVPFAFWAVWMLGDAKQRLPRAAVFVGGMVALGLWWPLRNYQIAGQWFPCLIAPDNQAVQSAFAKSHPLELLRWAWNVLQTGVLPDWAVNFIPPVFAMALVVLGLAVIVLLFVVKGGDTGTDNRYRQLQIMALSALAFLIFGIVLYSVRNDFRAQIGGRYLLNGIGWLAVYLGASLMRILGVKAASVRAAPPAGGGSTQTLLVGAVPVALWLGTVMWWYLASLFYQNPANFK